MLYFLIVYLDAHYFLTVYVKEKCGSVSEETRRRLNHPSAHSYTIQILYAIQYAPLFRTSPYVQYSFISCPYMEHFGKAGISLYLKGQCHEIFYPGFIKIKTSVLGP
jgi:hypothetical protein